jgi:H+/Cl- antiporter ClcA
MVPASLLYLIVLVRSDVDNRFSMVTAAYLVCVVAYVIYQLQGGNPFDNPEEMVRQATIQKLVVIASVVSIFSLSFAFQKQIDILNAK